VVVEGRELGEPVVVGAVEDVVSCDGREVKLAIVCSAAAHLWRGRLERWHDAGG
jgi:hypothetical protein